MSNWLSLEIGDQIDLFTQAEAESGLPAIAIEKDAWVTLVLRMLFASELSDNIVFKGGTSLSKVYGLIMRFSEDVDMAIDRAYLGYEELLSKGEIRKLRRASHDFSLNKMPDILHTQLEKYGIDPDKYKIDVPNTKVSDQDPEIIFLNYKSVFEEEGYLPDRVQIEIGARSLNEPFSKSSIQSIIDEKLFRAICNHRTVFTPIKGVDYEGLKLSGLNILPTGDFVGLYKDDYQAMRENMIYVKSPEFEEIIDTLGNVLR